MGEANKQKSQLRKIVLGKFYGKDVYIEVSDEEANSLDWIKEFEGVFKSEREEGYRQKEDELFIKSLKNNPK
ncbi:MAG: hypothetical protein ACOCQ4_01715 [bacterium]